MLYRTPYSLKPYTVDFSGRPGEVTEAMAKDKFIFALQDVRGRFGSEGQFVHVRPHKDIKSSPNDIDESTDTWAWMADR